MALAIIVGILVGALSVVPFFVAIKNIRKVDPTFSLNLLGPFLLTIVVSFLILLAGLALCKLIAPDVIVPFAAAEIFVFVAGVLVLGLYKARQF